MLHVLTAAFFLSGMASLTFQVAWQRLLTLYYGVGPVSVALIVSVYMLGLGFGALLGGLVADRARRPALWYLGIELGLGVFGLASVPALAWLGRATSQGSPWVSLAAIACFLCLPTLGMGMTLPIVVKIFNRSTRGFLDAVSFLYFVNTLGAAAGALFSGYVLISFFGLDWALKAASLADMLIGAAIFLCSLREKPPAAEEAVALERGGPALGKAAYAIVAVTGFLAIGYELAWFRLLTVLVKASAYAFCTMLGVYLAGVAFGSLLSRRFARGRRLSDRQSLFFGLQVLIGFYVVASIAGFIELNKIAAFSKLVADSFHGRLHPAGGLGGWLGWVRFLDIVLWPAAFMFVPAALMGASFPLIADLALTDARRDGGTVGTAYFFNTVGNVLGGAITGFVLLPALGTERTLAVLSATGLAFLVLVKTVLGRPLAVPLRIGLSACGVLLALAVFPRPGELYALIHQPPPPGSRSHFDEGISGVVMTRQRGEHVVTYIDGLAHGGRPGHGFFREVVEAVAYCPELEEALIIGFGTGSFAEALLKAPTIKEVDLVELNASLLRNLARIPVLRGILSDPRLKVTIDDGRRVLLRTARSYDLILMDPLRSTTAYSNNLYSRQFFELAARRLRPRGVLLAWIDEHHVLPKTLASAFPYVRQYDHFCLASKSPLAERRGRRERFLARFSAEDREVMARIIERYRGDQDFVARNTEGYRVNEDWRPNLEYFLGHLWRGHAWPGRER